MIQLLIIVARFWFNVDIDRQWAIVAIILVLVSPAF